MNLVVAGTRDGLVMVEGGAKMLPEDVMLDALFTAHQEMQVVLDMQDELQRTVGKPKREITAAPFDEALFGRVNELLRPRVEAAFQLAGKQERAAALHEAEDERGRCTDAGVSRTARRPCAACARKSRAGSCAAPSSPKAAASTAAA